MKIFFTDSKLFFLLLILNVGICLPSVAQITFEKTYPLPVASVGKSVKQTFDGGYIVAGTIVTKTTDSGNVDWIYYSPADYVNTTADSGYILIRNNTDVLITKLDKIGDTIWTNVYNEGVWAREAHSIEQTTDGGYIVAGRFQDVTGSGMMLLKLDNLGNKVWKQTYREPTSAAFCYGRSAHQTADGGYIMTGYTYINFYDTNRHLDIMLVKTDSAGNQQWIKYFGNSTTEDVAYAVQEITSSGYIVAGSQLDSATNITNMYLLKLNLQGDTVWTRTYGTAHTSEFKSVGITSDGGYILTGHSNISSTGGPSNVSVFRTDSLGNIIWTKEFGGNNADVSNEILQTTDGGYILTGVANASAITSGVMYLIKMDSLGNVLAPLSIKQTHLDAALIKIYPNPASGTIFIETDVATTQICLFGVDGKMVLQQKISSGKSQIAIQSLSDGIYGYQIWNEEGIIQIGKLLIRNK